MCGIVSIDQYRAQYADQIKVEYTNPKTGAEALIVQSWASGPVYTIESDDGREYRSHTYGPNGLRSYEEQIIAAHTRLTGLGYYVQGEEPRVQGKTLDEWEKEGYLNDERDPEDHVHPEQPEGREPTSLEMMAFINSLSLDETFAVAYAQLGEEALASALTALS